MLHVLGISRSDANHRLRQATNLHTVTTPTGSVIQAALPLTAAALQRGEIGPEHVEVIQKLHGSLKHLEPDRFALAEELMMDKAFELDPPALRLHIERNVLDVIDPDGPPPTDDEPHTSERALRLHKRRDGSLQLKGQLDPATGDRFEALLKPFNKRETDDTRAPAERLGDAFADVLALAANCPDLPTHNGLKSEVAVTVSLEWLKQATDGMVLPGTALSARDIRLLACDAHVLPAVMDGDSKPADIVVPAYVVPAHIRRALVLRDRGCTFPGCPRPASMSDSHHVTPWSHGGTTELANLALLCPRHHRLIHNSDWTITMIDGLPSFIPPDYVDPQRTPRRNTLHPTTNAA